MPTIQSPALSSLRLAPENARHACKADVRNLMRSIATEGLLDPLHGYQDGKSTLIWDGGRRLRAIKALAKVKQLPESLRRGVPVLISDRDAARLHSLMTFVREDMHPAQEFRAYRKLFDEGESPDRIAAPLGVDSRRVAQLLKLSNLAPEILEAFEAGDFGLDTAQAFTLTDDREKQRAALAACGGWIDAGRVRQLLRSGMTGPRDRLARFIGREAYEAAGGGFVRDLFAVADDNETWTDSGLVERLAAEKIENAVAEIKAEGWGWVTVVQPDDYAWSRGFERLKADPVELSAVEAAEFDRAAATLEDESADAAEVDAASAVMARLETVMETATFTADQKAAAGVFVQLGYGGALAVHRGYVAASAGLGATPAKVAVKADPALYGWGHTGHWYMTHIATAAVRHGLLRAPDAAYDILLASLAWTLAGGGSDGALRLRPGGVEPRAIPSEARLRGEAAWEAARLVWRQRIPTDSFAECFAFVAGLADAEKAGLLAIAVGAALDGVETRFDHRHHAGWEQLTEFARRAGVDVAAAWKPDRAFLAKGSKAALLGVLAETGGAEAYAKAKKGELVGAILKRLETQTWLPKLLRSISDADRAMKIAAE